MIGNFIYYTVINLLIIRERDIVTLEKKGARCIDALGRVVIPRDVRKALGFESGESVEFFVDNKKNSLIIRKYNSTCALCGSSDELTELDGKYVCKDCVKKISKLN